MDCQVVFGNFNVTVLCCFYTLLLILTSQAITNFMHWVLRGFLKCDLTSWRLMWKSQSRHYFPSTYSSTIHYFSKLIWNPDLSDSSLQSNYGKPWGKPIMSTFGDLGCCDWTPATVHTSPILAAVGAQQQSHHVQASRRKLSVVLPFECRETYVVSATKLEILYTRLSTTSTLLQIKHSLPFS